MEAICVVCGKIFHRSPTHIKRVKNPTCSRDCRDEMRRKPKIILRCDECGISFEKYPSHVRENTNLCSRSCFKSWWHKQSNGWLSAGGYRYIHVVGRGEIFEHRHVMEQHLGRLLDDNEVVHHKDGDGLNNSIENLELMTRSTHTTHHNTGKSRKGQKHPPCSEETKRKISLAKKGTVLSKEHRRKIGESIKRVRAKRYWSSRKK